MQHATASRFSALVVRPLIALALCAGAFSSKAHAQGTPIGFEEEFALSDERGAVLGRLVAGTEDFYWFHCLYAQHTGDLDAVPPLLALWKERHGETQRYDTIVQRQALLSYERDPEGTYEHLVHTLGLRYDQRQEVPGSEPELPTRLDPKLIEVATLVQSAMTRSSGSLSGFKDSFLDEIAMATVPGVPLDDRRLTTLLERLRRSDLPGLPALVVRHLDERKERQFGSLEIHRLLTLAQLEECAALHPQLLEERAFVDAVLARLAPAPDAILDRDPAARLAHLDRLASFANRLSAVFVSLKAQVQYHRLALDLEQGNVDANRLRTYLTLPRVAVYTPRAARENKNTSYFVDPSANFQGGLPAIGNDEPLVRACLAQLLRNAESVEPWSSLVDRRWLEQLFAQTKLLAGIGDMEKWYTMLGDPALAEQLEKRVDLEFPVTQSKWFAVGEPVKVDLDVKNVGTLIVKVFELDALSYYTSTGREIPADIDLDGLVPTRESTYAYSEPPLRRVRRNFEFPELNGAGAWVIEFVGNGTASRILVRKGQLTLTERTGAAGHVFQIFDEKGERHTSGAILFAGRRYEADDQGEIVLPFTTNPGRRSLIVQAGARTSLATFDHQVERYQLEAGFFVERETLTRFGEPRLLVRTRLFANDQPVSLGLLEDVVLHIAARDNQGVTTTLDVRDPQLDRDEEFVQELAAPQGLVWLSASLTGTVKSAFGGPDVALSAASQPFELNGISTTPLTGSALLGRSSKGYYVDLLGRNGEPRAGRSITLALVHRDFATSVMTRLQSDARGRIELGPLPGIVRVSTTGTDEDQGQWDLSESGRTFPGEIRGVVGETLRVPYTGEARSVTRDNFSLVATRGNLPLADMFDHLALEGGYLVMSGLTGGSHVLRLEHEQVTIAVNVVDGARQGALGISGTRIADLGQPVPLTLVSAAPSGTDLVIRLAGAAPGARVHVVATRYVPTRDALARLDTGVSTNLGTSELVTPASDYRAERDIGDEFRYILDRRLARTFAGNMLRRPGLLLNPWDIGEASQSFNESLELGGGVGGGGGAQGRRSGGRARKTSDEDAARQGPSADLDFLGSGGVLIANLHPDASGVVRVPLADLGGNQHVHVIVLDDEYTVRRSLALEETPLEPVDQRLAAPLDPTRLYGERRAIEILAAGASTNFGLTETSQFQTYETLGDVYALYATLGGGEELGRFEFLLRWPKLAPSEKGALYSQHACHELNLFVYRKDREFFDAVVRPYLANKLAPTFLDDWLLGRDLAPYLESWAFARLNVLERILLGRRLREQSGPLARHVAELLALIPPETLALGFEERFKLALAADGLDAHSRVADAGGAFHGPGDTVPPGQSADARPAMRAANGALPPAAEPGLSDEKKDKNSEASKAGSTDFFLGDGDAEDDNAPVLDSALRELEQLGGTDRQDQSRDELRRGQARNLFRPVDATHEFAESNYWKRRIVEQDANLVGVNAFWLDLAQCPADTLFLSSQFAAASSSVNEMLLALAMLDLPFEAPGTVRTVNDRGATLKAGTPLVIVRRDLALLPLAVDAPPVLVSQDFFRGDERLRFDGTRMVDAFVKDEFLSGTTYGCRVVVTNPTSSPRELELLCQIPAGSIPVSAALPTRGVPIRLDPYGTTTFEYAFYFPAPGVFAHYPVVVAEGESVVASAPAVRFDVRVEPSTVDTTSWEYVSQRSPLDEVLAYLGAANVQRLDLTRIAWRLRDRAVFDRVLAALRERFVYDPVLWSFGLLHRDAATTSEFLERQDAYLARCGTYLDAPLVSIDPVERRWYEQLEFDPLVNARAHQVKGQRELLNADVAAQYLGLIGILDLRPTLDDADWANVTYYLLLQDRVEEALAAFARIDRAKLATQIQYDYLAAYLDFFSDDHKLARGIATRYLDHPVERWRKLFAEVVSQLDEAEGRTSGITDEGDATQRQTALADSEPALELVVEGRRVKLTHQNLAACEVSYYPMDIEFLFSANPFVEAGSGSFAYVRPKRRDTVSFEAGTHEQAFDLPAEFANANVLVEVRAGALVRRQTVFAGSLSVQWMENYGQVRVTRGASGGPLPKVYVKVFAREANGTVRFHKDGYTDLRGRFDYASLSGEGSNTATRYAVLVLSEEDGAVVREMAPPAR